MELVGHFKKSRKWLLNYLKTAKFKNNVIEDSLLADWSDFSHQRAAYLLGCLWGRLRQVNSDLENATDYGLLVVEELEEENDNATE